MPSGMPQNSQDSCKRERPCPKKDVKECVWQDVLGWTRQPNKHNGLCMESYKPHATGDVSGQGTSRQIYCYD